MVSGHATNGQGMVKGASSKSKRSLQIGQHRAQADELADVGQVTLTINCHILLQVVHLQPLRGCCRSLSRVGDCRPKQCGEPTAAACKRDDVAQQRQELCDRREGVDSSPRASMYSLRAAYAGLCPSPRERVVAARHTRDDRREYVTGNGRYVGQRLHTRVDSGSCGPQATWDRASQGAPRFAM